MSARPAHPVPLVLLDFDGVVAATETPARQLLADMVAPAIGRSVAEVEAVIYAHPGLRFIQMIEPFERALGVRLTAETMARISDSYENETLALFEREGIATGRGFLQALQTVKAAHQAAIRIGSNSSLRRLAVSLSTLQGGIGPAVRALLDDVHSAVRFKPDPQVYVDAIGAHWALHGQLPSRVVIVEDSPAGATGALGAKAHWKAEVPVHVVGYPALTHRPQEIAAALQAMGLDLVVDGEDWGFLPALLAQPPA